MTDEPVRGIGDNKPPPFETFSLEANNVLDQARKLLTEYKQTITEPEVGEKVAGFKKQIADLVKRADDERKNEKQPFLDAGRAVDAKWAPIQQQLNVALDTVQKKLTAHLKYLNDEREKQRLATEQEKKRLEEEAARKQAEADELMKKAEAGELKDTGIDPLQAKLDAEAAKDAVKEASKEVKDLQGSAKVGGSYVVGGVKRSLSMRKTYHAEIKNAKLLAVYFADEPRVLEVLQALANTYVRAANNPDHEPPPGCTVRTEESAV